MKKVINFSNKKKDEDKKFKKIGSLCKFILSFI